MKVETLKQWCEEFSKFNPQPMSEDLTGIFINLSLNEDDIEKDQELAEKMKTDFFSQIIITRQKLYGYNLSKSVIILLGVICNSPGEIVMYMTYLYYKFLLRGIADINLMEFSYYFPMGFPDREFLNSMWDLQKVKALPDNMLDNIERINKLATELKLK